MHVPSGAIVAEDCTEHSGGRSFAGSKTRFRWLLSVEGQTYNIEFTHSKASGMKRVFVDGKLKVEQQVKLACDFKYSWKIAGHDLSIVPLAKSAIDAFCDFDLHIDGLPFKQYKRLPGATQTHLCNIKEVSHKSASGIFAGGCSEKSSGRSFGGSKTRYAWHVLFDDRNYKIEFANSKASGMKRVFVNGRLEHESQAMLSTDFQYSWRLDSHVLSIVPKDARGAIDPFCSFDLHVDGYPFQDYEDAQKHRRNTAPRSQRASSEHSRRISPTGEPQSVNTGKSLGRRRSGSVELRTGPHRDERIGNRQVPFNENGQSAEVLWQAVREQQRVATEATWSGNRNQEDAQLGPSGVKLQASASEVTDVRFSTTVCDCNPVHGQDPWASQVAPTSSYDEPTPSPKRDITPVSMGWPAQTSSPKNISVSPSDPWASIATGGISPSAVPKEGVQLSAWDPWGPINAHAPCTGPAVAVPEDPWQASW